MHVVKVHGPLGSGICANKGPVSAAVTSIADIVVTYSSASASCPCLKDFQSGQLSTILISEIARYCKLTYEYFNIRL